MVRPVISRMNASLTFHSLHGGVGDSTGSSYRGKVVSQHAQCGKGEVACRGMGEGRVTVLTTLHGYHAILLISPSPFTEAVLGLR